MNSHPPRKGKLILTAAVALLATPFVATIVSADLSAYSLTATLVGKGFGLLIIALVALATYRLRWPHPVIGSVAATLGLVGLLSFAANIVLLSRGDVAVFQGRLMISFGCFVFAALFLAWALLLSREVREHGQGR